MQTIFMTPAGELFHVATGFIPADELAVEIKFALQLFQQISRGEKEHAKSGVVNAHRKRLADLGFNEDEINSRPGMESFMQLLPGGNFDLARQNMGRSSNRSLTGKNQFAADLSNPETMFAGMVKRQILEDHQYMITSPLVDYREFESDPGKLVGNGKSFFASSSSQ